MCLPISPHYRGFTLSSGGSRTLKEAFKRPTQMLLGLRHLSDFQSTLLYLTTENSLQKDSFKSKTQSWGISNYFKL